jgi:endonuclease G
MEARELQRERVSVLLDWHRANPVEEYQRHRNAAIAELQGNRNPLIDQPEWAERIDFDASFVG